MKVGLIGFGFIGRAFAHGFHLHADIKIYDKYNKYEKYDSLEDTVNQDILFVNVPTPMHEDGSQDLSNVDDVIYNINKVANKTKIIVIRTTVIPGTTRNYAEKYKEHSFIFNPEFLTQRSYKLDFINPSRIILGCKYPNERYKPVDFVYDLYKSRFPHIPIYVTTWEGAEVVKYMSNTFFAVKIAFMNEMYEVAEKFGLKYNDLKDMFLADGRIGNSHVDVPGHDGYKGYGGKCFPKDIQAFIKWAENCGLYLDMCKAAEKVNNRVREKKDWEDIKGATSKNDYKSNAEGMRV